MNGVQTRLKCKPNVKRCKRFVFPSHSPLLHHNALTTKAISHFQADHILTRFVFPPLYLRHGDNVQNESTITPGEIQVMSTGTGIYHSEYNASKTEDLKFLQIWVIPNVEETKPEYHNYNIRPLLKRNELATFISPSGNTPAHLLQDTWFSIGTFDAGHSVIYRMHKPRTGVYIFVIEGESNVAGENLSRRDGIGIWDIESVTIEATSETQILAIEVAM